MACASEGSTNANPPRWNFVINRRFSVVLVPLNDYCQMEGRSVSQLLRRPKGPATTEIKLVYFE